MPIKLQQRFSSQERTAIRVFLDIQIEVAERHHRRLVELRIAHNPDQHTGQENYWRNLVSGYKWSRSQILATDEGRPNEEIPNNNVPS